MALPREFQPSNVRPHGCFPVQNSNAEKLFWTRVVLGRPLGAQQVRSLPISVRPIAVGGRLTAPWFCIHPAERRVGRPVSGFWSPMDSTGVLKSDPTKSGAPPLCGDRVVQGGKLQTGVDGLVTCHLSLVTALLNSSWELTVGSSSMEKLTATKAVTLVTHC